MLPQVLKPLAGFEQVQEEQLGEKGANSDPLTGQWFREFLGKHLPTKLFSQKTQGLSKNVEGSLQSNLTAREKIFFL